MLAARPAYTLIGSGLCFLALAEAVHEEIFANEECIRQGETWSLGCAAASSGAADLFMLQMSARAAAHNKEKLIMLRTNASVNGAQGRVASTIVQPGGDAAPRTAIKAHLAHGVKLNKKGDLPAFLASLKANACAVFICVATFMMLKKRYPKVYCENVISGLQPYQIPDVWFGWARASLGISVEEVSESVGLDQGMLLEFMHMNLKIIVRFGLPMALIMGPANCFFGGGAAGEDRLSYISMGNVVSGSSLYWLYAFAVWGVVVTVQSQIFATMEKMMDCRMEWLQKMPAPRATSIMVEGIPHDYQTDDRLKDFFTKLFGQSKVSSAYVAKRDHGLKRAFNKKSDAVAHLEALKPKWEENGSDPEARPKSLRGVDLIEYYENEITQADDEILRERAHAKLQAANPGGMNGSSGFVTFHYCSDAQVAVRMQYDTDSEKWVTSVPPPPEAIRWKDLEQHHYSKVAWMLLGYLLTFGLYVLYTPVTIWISNVAVKIQFDGPLQAYWEGLAPSVGLQFMVTFLPTFLVTIFEVTMTLYDVAYAQLLLQDWLFLFQFVFVIMVTTIGDSLGWFMWSLVESPLRIMPLMAETMPKATHFYMDFLVLGLVTHALNLIRYMNLGKFLTLRRLYDEQRAKALSEPEAQDYYGQGARHARHSIMMSIVIIFGTYCPLVGVLGLIYFGFCRLVYGYLIPFAETKKPDLGGEFFVQAVFHLFFASVIYVLLMTGILASHASSLTPACLAFSSLIYVVWCMWRFRKEFNYKMLPFPVFFLDKADADKHESTGVYVQPEWVE